MDTSAHTFNSLFAQLGLPEQTVAIDAFIASHRPLPAGTCLSQAAFWTRSQRAFLEEALAEDSDWSEIVDQLDVRLR